MVNMLPYVFVTMCGNDNLKKNIVTKCGKPHFQYVCYYMSKKKHQPL